MRNKKNVINKSEHRICDITFGVFIISKSKLSQLVLFTLLWHIRGNAVISNHFNFSL